MWSQPTQRFLAVGVLIAWLGAVVGCALEPVALCHSVSDQRTETDHHHGGEADHHHSGTAEHSEAGNASDHHPKSPAPFDPCADNSACLAIKSAVSHLVKLSLPDRPIEIVTDLFNLRLSPSVKIRLTTSVTLSVTERVLLLRHEVCTRSAVFSLAPPQV